MPSGAVVYGILTVGFWVLPGIGFDLRGTAFVNVFLIVTWLVVAWRLRAAYVQTIQESIHRHRMDTERTSSAVLERSAAEALRDKLAAGDPGEVRYALSLLEGQRTHSWHPALRALLHHSEADVRQRALALLAAAGDREIAADAVALLRDPDLSVRTEALLYLSREQGIDPLAQIEKLGDFADFSIRAGMAAFLASPGPAQNLDAARAILTAMTKARGREGSRERAEAARLIALVPAAFEEMLPPLLADPDLDVVRQAIQTARTMVSDDPDEALIDALIGAIGRPEINDDAAEALARFGNVIVPGARAPDRRRCACRST